MRRHLWILVLPLVAAATTASAEVIGTANVTWTSGDVVYFHDTGTVKATFKGKSYGAFYSPPYRAGVNITSITDPLYDQDFARDLGVVPVFCIELQQSVEYGSFQYNIVDLASAPQPGGPDSPMGQEKAKLLRRLWYTHYNDAMLDANNNRYADNEIDTVAFAASVWEIVFETSTTPYALNNGDFSLTYASVGTSGVISRANQFLQDAVNNTTSPDQLPSLFALSNMYLQDQMFFVVIPKNPGGDTHDEPIPEPGTIVQLLGLGLMGVVGYCRLRRRRAV